MPRPPLYATLLTLYGIAGLIALTIATGLIARTLTGASLAAVVARLVVIAVLFVIWLYTWRRLTLHMRERACRRLEERKG